MKKRYYCIIIFFLLLATFISYNAWELAQNYEPPEPKPEPEPEPPKPLETWYEYEGVVREKWKRPFGDKGFALLTEDGVELNFWQEVYACVQIDDYIKVYNWEGNWQAKRKMEIYRNGTYIAEFLVWYRK